MRIEIPEFKRCCFCVPLRYGLLTWAYLSLIPLALFMIANSIEFSFVIHYRDYPYIIWTTFLLLLTLGNSVSNIFLIVAAHKKSIKLLKIYNVYTLSVVATNFIFLVSYCIYVFVRIPIFFLVLFWIDLVAVMLTWLIYIGMQLYIMALVRSEIFKLESNHRFEFSNIAAEAEIAFYEPQTVKTDEQHTVDIENYKSIDENHTP